jgi:hypothetical protein
VQEPHADGQASGIGQVVVDIENIQQEWCVISWPAPPGGPGQQPVTSQRRPHPLRPPAALCKVVGEFLVEDVGQLVEKAEFFASADRTHGQVLQLHGQARSGERRLLAPRGQTRSRPREKTGAVIMGIMGVSLLSMS